MEATNYLQQNALECVFQHLGVQMVRVDKSLHACERRNSKTKLIWQQKTYAINAYSLFLKINDMHWEKPRCKVTRKIPFIPTEQELDALVACMQFTTKAAKTPEELKSLIEVGFEYVCQKDDLLFFRKRK